MILDYPGRSNKALKSGRGRLKRRVREDMRMKVQSDTSSAAGLEDGERDHKPRNVGGLMKLEKVEKKLDCPLETL